MADEDTVDEGGPGIVMDDEKESDNSKLPDEVINDDSVEDIKGDVNDESVGSVKEDKEGEISEDEPQVSWVAHCTWL